MAVTGSYFETGGFALIFTVDMPDFVVQLCGIGKSRVNLG